MKMNSGRVKSVSDALVLHLRQFPVTKRQRVVTRVVTESSGLPPTKHPSNGQKGPQPGFTSRQRWLSQDQSRESKNCVLYHHEAQCKRVKRKRRSSQTTKHLPANSASWSK